MLKHSPELLERRTKLIEKETAQKLIAALMSMVILFTYLLSGLDKRYSWSTVPAPIVIAAEGVALLGFALYFLVVKENAFASRIVVVEENQEVITIGPYALVRHPMYTAILLIYLCTPVALGSYWTMIPASSLAVLLVARIRNEELTLSRELEGYHEYKENVKYRLVLGVW